MQIAAFEIKNFRSIANVEGNLYSIASFVGPNNCGKSTIFKAIELFFDASPKISSEDFHRMDSSVPIVVRLTFANFTPDEVAEFGNAIVGDRLTVSREFSLGDSSPPNYSVNARANPRFDTVRTAASASEKLSAYRLIQSEFGLPTARSSNDVDAAILNWEAENKDELTIAPIRGFFGATNVANGKLKKKTSLRLIPAVHDASDVTKSGKKSPVLELLADIVRQTFENRTEIRQLIQETEAKLAQLTNPETIPELSGISSDITGILQRLYADARVIATWDQMDSLNVNFPKPKVSVENDGTITEIDLVGHGLQRVVLFSLIQYMAERLSKSDFSDDQYVVPQSDIIILIEEPEIYQHPIKQITLYENFKNIVKEFNKSSGIIFQIIFTTHSEKFVKMEDFEICNIVSKKYIGGKTENQISNLLLSKCVIDFASFHEPPIEPMSEDSFASKLHIFTREICEGFFAKKIVLVEGQTDKPVLEAYFDCIGRNHLLEGIQVISVGGKSNLDKPAYIFRGIGIPTYVVFDNDDKKQDQKERQKSVIRNRILQKAIGSENVEDMPTGRRGKFYAFEGDLERYLKSVVGSESYDRQFDSIATSFGVVPKDIKKSPSAFAMIMRTGLKAGYKFTEFDNIIAEIDAL